MADLDRILQLFARQDVEEIVLSSGRPVCVKMGGQVRPASQAKLAPAQIAGLLRAIPNLPELPLPGAPAQSSVIEYGGRRLSFSMAVSQTELIVRITRAARTSAPTGPAHAKREVSTAGPRPTPPAPAQRPASPAPSAPGAAPASPTRARQAPAPAPKAAAPPRASAATPAAKPTPKPASVPAPARSPAVGTTAQPKGDASLDRLLVMARQRGASDVHLTSGRPALIRTRGELIPEGADLDDARLRPMLESTMTEPLRKQYDEVGYADFAYEAAGAGRFRVNVCAHKNGIKGCFRVVAAAPQSLEELGLPPEIANVIDHHQGLAIVSGPNGQGKSTTLASIVDLLNSTKAVHVITVEDPIEIVHPIKSSILSQRQVGRDTRTFQSALKGALRQDPDVIVIGELRDRETVEMALSAAETGHLVIATMNTPSGAKTIGRLIDLFPPDDQAQVRATLAGTLMIVVSQRLIPTANGEGRIVAAEVITGGVPLWTLIRENKLVQLPGLMQRGRSAGMIALDDSLKVLYDDGTITREEALRYATDKSGFVDPAEVAAQEAANEAQQAEGRFSGLRKKMMGGRAK